EYPNTLRLVTYGGDLLADLLAAVSPPREAAQGGQLVRCSAAAPVERVGWYAVGGGSLTPGRTLAELQTAIRSPEGTGGLPAASVAAARERFDRELGPLREQEVCTAQARDRSRAEALAEEIRDLLLQAAYVELVKASAEGMFAADRGADFSVEAVRRLRRLK